MYVVILVTSLNPTVIIVLVTSFIRRSYSSGLRALHIRQHLRAACHIARLVSLYTRPHGFGMRQRVERGNRAAHPRSAIELGWAVGFGVGHVVGSHVN